jgi:transmembrane sensor
MKPLNAMDLRIAEEAADWLMRLEECAPGHSRSEFVAWLKHSPRHMEEFLLVSAAYRAMQDVDPDRRIDVESLVANGTAADVVRLHEQGEELEYPRARHGGFRRRVAVLAAAIGILALGSIVGVHYLDSGQTYATAVGEQRTLKLDDGSVVYLNTLSRVRVAFSGRERAVTLLDGEALFEVAHDAVRPFRVLTDTAAVQAIGTRFNVYRHRDSTAVSVVEGRVQVTPLKRYETPDPQILEPLTAGQEADVAEDGRVVVKPVTPASASHALAWRQRQLVFYETSLREIAEQFNRYNKVQIRVLDRALAGRRLTAVFNADNPGTLLKFLASDETLVFERTEREIVIRERRAKESLELPGRHLELPSGLSPF